MRSPALSEHSNDWLLWLHTLCVRMYCCNTSASLWWLQCSSPSTIFVFYNGSTGRRARFGRSTQLGGVTKGAPRIPSAVPRPDAPASGGRGSTPSPRRGGLCISNPSPCFLQVNPRSHGWSSTAILGVGIFKLTGSCGMKPYVFRLTAHELPISSCPDTYQLLV